MSAFDHTTHRGIGHSISNRARLLSDLSAALARQDALDAMLRERLLKKAPTALHEWLTEDAILSGLFKGGKAHTKVRYGEYGFKSAADAEGKMKALRSVWKDVVTIDVDTRDPGRAEIIVAALL